MCGLQQRASTKFGLIHHRHNKGGLNLNVVTLRIDINHSCRSGRH